MKVRVNNMSNLCLECYNELHETDYKPEEVWLKYRLCDRCQEWSLCVHDLSPSPYMLMTKEIIKEYYAKKEADKNNK